MIDEGIFTDIFFSWPWYGGTQRRGNKHAMKKELFWKIKLILIWKKKTKSDVT